MKAVGPPAASFFAGGRSHILPKSAQNGSGGPVLFVVLNETSRAASIRPPKAAALPREGFPARMDLLLTKKVFATSRQPNRLISQLRATASFLNTSHLPFYQGFSRIPSLYRAPSPNSTLTTHGVAGWGGRYYSSGISLSWTRTLRDEDDSSSLQVLVAFPFLAPLSKI